jgi:hypothetical protein
VAWPRPRRRRRSRTASTMTRRTPPRRWVEPACRPTPAPATTARSRPAPMCSRIRALRSRTPSTSSERCPPSCTRRRAPSTSTCSRGCVTSSRGSLDQRLRRDPALRSGRGAAGPRRPVAHRPPVRARTPAPTAGLRRGTPALRPQPGHRRAACHRDAAGRVRSGGVPRPGTALARDAAGGLTDRVSRPRFSDHRFSSPAGRGTAARCPTRTRCGPSGPARSNRRARGACIEVRSFGEARAPQLLIPS